MHILTIHYKVLENWVEKYSRKRNILKVFKGENYLRKYINTSSERINPHSKALLSEASTLRLLLLSHQGSFINSVDKKRGGVRPLSPGIGRTSIVRHVTKGKIVCRMSNFVHSMGVGDQKLVKFGPRI